MKRILSYALLTVIICTFSMPQPVAACIITKTDSIPGEYASRAGTDGFQRIKLPGSSGSGQKALSFADLRDKAFDGYAVESIGLEGVGPDMLKVLSVVRQRIADQTLLEKVRDKLSTLSDSRLRLAVSLSERAADGRHDVKTDVAFLLLTTLIIFS